MELADLIMGQVSQEDKAPVAAEREEECMLGISLQRWKATSGTELMYNGQGEYVAALPREREGQQVSGADAVEERDRRVGNTDTTSITAEAVPLLEEQLSKQFDQSSCEHTTSTDAEAVQPHSVHTTSIAAEAVPPLTPSAKEAGYSMAGMRPPQLAMGDRISGDNKHRLKIENKHKRIERQLQQNAPTYWKEHEGLFGVPPALDELEEWRNEMCPSGLALHHPAAGQLLQYATGGCPVNSGQNWTMEMIETAIARGPHVSALVPEAIEQLNLEVIDKAKKGQCRVVEWEQLKKDGVPPQLKISPIAMIPHKSRMFRAILDLSFSVRLRDGSKVTSVNDGTTLEAPAGAIDQLGHSLMRVIHAFAEADPDAKIFMVKFDIKDGFWRLDCQKGEEWNFAYVLPQAAGEPVRLVIPTSLQMGWVESPPYFCAASETARDVGEQYMETPVGSLPRHKFTNLAMAGADVATLPETADSSARLRYFLDVYVDDFISLAIAASRQQLEHVATATMQGIHDVFPSNSVDSNDPISYKKILKGEGVWALQKDILGFLFDGEAGAKTLQLEAPKREMLLAILHKWIRSTTRGKAPIPFTEFRSVISKLRHAFISIPAGVGLLSPCNAILAKEPKVVALGRNASLLQAIRDCRTLLREATERPTPCRELVNAWPEYVGVVDASKHGVGGVIVGEAGKCIPTVFRIEWPMFIKSDLVSEANRNGTITNSDLEMAGLLLLWLVMEEVCDLGSASHVSLFSDNSPTVHWVRRLAARGSLVATQLVRALALRLKVRGASPLTPLHIEGKKNAMTDVPSRSFGSEPKWLCHNDVEFLSMYNKFFPLPNQQSWTVFKISTALFTRVLSALQMKGLEMDEWRRLPKSGKFVGAIGEPTASLWDWTLIYRVLPMGTSVDTSWGSQEQSEVDATVRGVRSAVGQQLKLSRPLARRFPWTQG